MSLRLTDAQFAALTGQKPEKKKSDVLLADGYRSKWSGTKTVGGQTCKFRSLSEYNYACYLEWMRLNHQILDWEYEPKKFDFPRIYKTTPFNILIDFRVTELNRAKKWHEVKGWMNPKSKKKIKRFHKHFPEEGEIIVIDMEWFKQNGKKLSKLVPGWKTIKTI